MRTFRRRSHRIRPLLNIFSVWNRITSTYPDSLLVAMKDGRVVRYDLCQQSVRINTGKNGWAGFEKGIVGYKNCR